MSTVTTQTLVKKLTEGSVSFKFRKLDGTIRDAVGTLNSDIIPESERSSIVIPSAEATTITYFDEVKQGWRNFRADSVITA